MSEHVHKWRDWYAHPIMHHRDAPDALVAWFTRFCACGGRQTLFYALDEKNSEYTPPPDPEPAA